MAIKYKVVAQKQPGVKGGGQTRYYARICGRQKISIKTLANNIESSTIIHHVDFQAVILALLSWIPKSLLDGKSVWLGDFGTFSVSLTSKPSDSPEKVTAADIEKVNVQFRPGPEFKQMLKEAKFEKAG
jgi:predicted histone-like DNA-binding protein